MGRTMLLHNDAKPVTTIEPEALSEREACAFLAVSPRLFRQFISDGDIRPIKIPGVRRNVFAVVELRALLESWKRKRDAGSVTAATPVEAA